jgi:hypothetical protein
MVRRIGFAVVATTLLLAQLARAEEPGLPGTDDGPVVVPPRGYPTVEVSLGFMGALRDERTVGFSYKTGPGGDLPGGQALVEPFGAAPYDRVPVYGLGAEARVVSHHVRITTGFAKPFAQFRLGDVATPTVSPRSLSLADLRFGLGGEWAFKYAAPFIDLMGDAQWVSTEIALEGRSTTYAAWTFGFTVRGGVRLELSDNFFVVPMGEWGLTGPTRFGAQLQVGWRLGG